MRRFRNMYNTIIGSRMCTNILYTIEDLCDVVDAIEQIILSKIK